MLKPLLGATSLAMVMVTTAPAQLITFDGGANHNGWSARFTGLNVPATGNFALNSAFQVWCVDQKHGVVATGQYVVNVSRIDGDLTNTRLGNAGASSYRKAAYLAATMGNGPGTVENKQYAIWAVIHGKTAIECRAWAPLGDGGNFDLGNGDLANCDVNEVIGNVNDAGNNAWKINTKQWYLLSGNPAISPNMQELIAHCQPKSGQGPAVVAAAEVGDGCDNGFTPPNEEAPTPEPATISLLALGFAGLAGSSLRRRKGSR